MGTAIAWTDETWNPTVGCSRVSPGCDNCYAVTVARREMQPAHKGLTVGGDWTGEVRHPPDRLDTPLHWRRPRRVFVDSMSDLFHPDVAEGFIGDVWNTMGIAEQHTFQVLTKRPQRMAEIIGRWWGAQRGMWRRSDMGWCGWEDRGPLPNVWLGVSVENQRYADLRVPHLLATPAAVRFLSIEPLLGPVDLTGLLDGIGWVIVGGESGSKARYMDPEWVRVIRDQCETAGIPFFFKQAGALLAKEWGCSDRAGDKIEEFPTEFQIQEFPV